MRASDDTRIGGPLWLLMDRTAYHRLMFSCFTLRLFVTQGLDA